MPKLPLDLDLVGRILLVKDGKKLRTGMIAEAMAPEAGLSRSTLTRKIVKYNEGYIFGDNLQYDSTSARDKEHLRIFAIYLSVLGIGINDPIIKKVRRYDSRFVYVRLSA